MDFMVDPITGILREVEETAGDTASSLPSGIEVACMEEDVEYTNGKFPDVANSRSKCNNDADGLVKILGDKKTDRLLEASSTVSGVGEKISGVGDTRSYSSMTASSQLSHSGHNHPQGSGQSDTNRSFSNLSNLARPQPIDSTSVMVEPIIGSLDLEAILDPSYTETVQGNNPTTSSGHVLRTKSALVTGHVPSMVSSQLVSLESGINSEAGKYKHKGNNLELTEVETVSTNSVTLRRKPGNISMKDILTKKLRTLTTRTQMKSVSIQTEKVKQKRKYSQIKLKQAMKIHYSSPTTYSLLRKEKILKLPHVDTLRRHHSHFKCRPGINDEIFELLSMFMKSWDEIDQNVCLFFDEVQTRQETQYCQRQKEVIKSASKAQVVIIRGIRKPFLQIIYYDFDTQMTKELLDALIVKTEKAGAKVRLVGGDMGNPKLLKDLRVVTERKYFFQNPYRKDAKIYICCDPIHQIKNLRNHCLDYGLLWTHDDGRKTTLTKKDFIELLEKDGKPGEIRKMFKITPHSHLDVTGHERQRVKPATQLFSATVAACFYLDGQEDKGDLVQTINDWFDISDSKTASHFNPMKQALGCGDQSLQLKTLLKMKTVMENMVVGPQTVIRKKKDGSKSISTMHSMKRFQKGIIVTIESYIALFHELKEEGLQYMMGRRLTQDILENIFSALRRLGGPNHHPSPKEFCQRVRGLMMSRNIDSILSDRTVVEFNHFEDTYKEQFLTSHLSSHDEAQKVLEQDDTGEDIEAQHVAGINFPSNQDALDYVSGYVTFKLKYPSEEPPPGSYTNLKSYGNLKKAVPEMELWIKTLDVAFNDLHGNSELELSSGPNIMRDTVNHMDKFCLGQGMRVPLKVIEYFMKVKFYARIKNMNSLIKETKKKNLRGHVKTGHFLN